MKAYMWFNHARYGYEIFLYDERNTERLPYKFDEKGYLGTRGIDAVPYGAEMPPTMFLDGDAYDALRKVMIGDVLDNDDALQDTRRLRDRLLTMIESEWQSKQLEKH